MKRQTRIPLCKTIGLRLSFGACTSGRVGDACVQGEHSGHVKWLRAYTRDKERTVQRETYSSDLFFFFTETDEIL